MLGQGYLHVQSRMRLTRDGGHSILAVDGSLGRVTTRLKRVSTHGIPIPTATATGATVTSTPHDSVQVDVRNVSSPRPKSPTLPVNISVGARQESQSGALT